jgi:transposase
MIRENYLYVGMDLHSRQHTAVVVNCWNEKLKVITIENKPSEFTKLMQKVNRVAQSLGVQPIYGLENVYGYGRALAVWLIEKGYVVKDINPSLAYDQRKSAPTFKKDDEYDALCVATALINHLSKLPDAKPDDEYWTLSQLVNRRDVLVKDGIRLKNGLHNQISVAYPSYHKFFSTIDRKTALYFYKTYPSPRFLQGKSADDLLCEFKEIMPSTKKNKAELILDCVLNDGNTYRDYQEQRDFITQSLVRCLETQKKEISFVDAEIERMLPLFGYKLQTLPGVNTVTAAKLIAEIGDISRFRNANKLAKYAGVSPVKFSSAGKGKETSSRQGNRTLNGVFYFMAVTMVCVVPGTGRPYQPIFREYFLRKVSEGKTKPQALVCIMRRLVSIVHGMMKNKTEYRPFVPEDQRFLNP